MTDALVEYQESLRQRLRGLVNAEAPKPWVALRNIAAGGLLAVGFSDDSTHLITVSTSGRAVFDLHAAALVARDRDPDVRSWSAANGSTAQGIGPLSGSEVRLAGIWGGGLSRYTDDGWSVRVIAPDWPDERVVLQPPGNDVLVERLSPACVQLDCPASEVQAVGFSPDGAWLVLATSSDVRLWHRERT